MRWYISNIVNSVYIYPYQCVTYFINNFLILSILSEYEGKRKKNLYYMAVLCCAMISNRKKTLSESKYRHSKSFYLIFCYFFLSTFARRSSHFFLSICRFAAVAAAVTFGMWVCKGKSNEIYFAQFYLILLLSIFREFLSILFYFFLNFLLVVLFFLFLWRRACVYVYVTLQQILK